MAISKKIVVDTDRAELRISRHVEDGWPDSVLVNMAASNQGFTATLHLTIDDAKQILAALSEIIDEEVTV